LFAEFGSVSNAPLASRSCADAVLVIAVDPMLTVTVTVALAPAAIAPRLQVRFVPSNEHAPCVVVDVWNGPGRLSVKVTCAAFCGPLLTTVIEYVTNAPTFTEAGPIIEIARSGLPGVTAGSTGADGADAGPVPVAFVAFTMNVYVVPFVRPMIFVPVEVPGTLAPIPDGTPPTSAETV
jgi:hypothetical protein